MGRGRKKRNILDVTEKRLEKRGKDSKYDPYVPLMSGRDVFVSSYDIIDDFMKFTMDLEYEVIMKLVKNFGFKSPKNMVIFRV